MKIKKQILKEKVEEVQDVMEQALEQSEISKKNFEEVTKKPSAIDVTLEREPKWMKKLPKGLVESYGPQLKENKYIFTVKNRKELADLIGQLKESKLEYKINRSLKEDYRYDVSINEAMEDEYYIYYVEASIPVYVMSRVCARDENEARELVEDWLETVEYANETVGFESNSDKVQPDAVDTWGSKDVMEIVDVSEDHPADKDELIEFGYDEDEEDEFDESLKESKVKGSLKAKLIQLLVKFKDTYFEIKDCFEQLDSDYLAELLSDERLEAMNNVFQEKSFDELPVSDFCNKLIDFLQVKECKESLKEELKVINGFECETGHTLDEYKKLFGDKYDKGELWDFSVKDVEDGAIEKREDVKYWLLKDESGEERVFEVEKEIEEACCKEEAKGIKHNSEEEKNFVGLEEELNSTDNEWFIKKLELDDTYKDKEFKVVNDFNDSHYTKNYPYVVYADDEFVGALANCPDCGKEKCEACKECNEELAKTNKQLQESVKIIEDIWEYEPWSGAIETWEKIEKADKVEDLDFLLEDIYPEGLTKTELNDLLWFEADWVLEQLGLDEEVDDTVEDEEEVKEVDYDRRAVEQEYELEDGELDGMTIREAETYLDLEDGELDRFVIEDKVEESLKESVKDEDNERYSLEWKSFGKIHQAKYNDLDKAKQHLEKLKKLPNIEYYDLWDLKTNKIIDSVEESLTESRDQWIYLFPDSGAMGDYKEECKKFNLKYLGKNEFEDEHNLVIKGRLQDLNDYAEWLGYELHPDYIYRENEFAGEIIDESLKEDVHIDINKEEIKVVDDEKPEEEVVIETPEEVKEKETEEIPDVEEDSDLGIDLEKEAEKTKKDKEEVKDKEDKFEKDLEDDIVDFSLIDEE